MSEEKKIDFSIAIGPVNITEPYQFAMWVDGLGQMSTIMTEQEQRVVSRVLRRAQKEFHLEKAEALEEQLEPKIEEVKNDD